MIAVVIPAYNAARFLPDSIASVRMQTAIELEVCVVDDGSTDDTAAVATSLGTDIHVVRQQNQGPAAARNAGVHATRAPFIAFLDADDTWPAGRLELLHRRLAADPALLIAMGQTQLVVPASSSVGAPLARSGAPWHAPVFGSTLIRREAFIVVGEIDGALQPAEDMDWFIRARECAAPTVIVDETTLLYRVHDASLTSGADPIRRNMLLALKRSLDRRRARSAQ
jgi:glycosyltransferase involved in cell wall biosynthesis